MTTNEKSTHDDDKCRPEIKVFFGHTEEGFPAAQVKDTIFALLPNYHRTFTVASCSRLRGPVEQWKRSDFYSYGPTLANEDAFRAYVTEYAEHLREVSTLSRRELSPGTSTPWGVADRAIQYAEGIIRYATPDHGGFYVHAEDNAKIHPLLQLTSGWYEEDCKWAAVAQAFPTLFTDYEKRHADETILHWYPDAWMAIHQQALNPGESHVHDRRQFERDHASHWIVISALTFKHPPGMVRCLATRGGNRQSKDVRYYLIPNQEYNPGQFGFVIDEAKYTPCGNDIWPRT